MSDNDIKPEQPTAGGRYFRQADGSLVREQAEVSTPAETETTDAVPSARTKRK